MIKKRPKEVKMQCCLVFTFKRCGRCLRNENEKENGWNKVNYYYYHPLLTGNLNKISFASQLICSSSFTSFELILSFAASISQCRCFFLSVCGTNSDDNNNINEGTKPTVHCFVSEWKYRKSMQCGQFYICAHPVYTRRERILRRWPPHIFASKTF